MWSKTKKPTNNVWTKHQNTSPEYVTKHQNTSLEYVTKHQNTSKNIRTRHKTPEHVTCRRRKPRDSRTSSLVASACCCAHGQGSAVLLWCHKAGQGSRGGRDWGWCATRGAGQNSRCSGPVVGTRPWKIGHSEIGVPHLPTAIKQCSLCVENQAQMDPKAGDKHPPTHTLTSPIRPSTRKWWPWSSWRRPGPRPWPSGPSSTRLAWSAPSGPAGPERLETVLGTRRRPKP